MRSFIVLVLLVYGVRGHANYSECEITDETAEDIQMHECRACSSISIPSLDSPSNCPSKGYECDEHLTITTNVLFADDECPCAYLRCVDSRTALAVDGSILKLGKVNCKARTWTLSNGTEISSFVCAKKCGLGVCEVLPRKSFEGDPTYGPLVISPPDADHPCAWGVCEQWLDTLYGYHIVTSCSRSDCVELKLNYYGLATFSCAGDRTWTYTGPEGEHRQLASVRCLITGELIRSFPPLTLKACEKFDDEKGWQEICSDRIVETADSINCPQGFNVLVVEDRVFTLYNEVVRDSTVSGGWCFKYEEEPCNGINDVETIVGTTYWFGCYTINHDQWNKYAARN